MSEENHPLFAAAKEAADSAVYWANMVTAGGDEAEAEVIEASRAIAPWRAREAAKAWPAWAELAELRWERYEARRAGRAGAGRSV